MVKINLKGSKAIVTGAGINLAFAKALYAKGCSVLIADIDLHADAQAFLETAQKARDSPTQVYFHKCDVRDWAQLEAVFDNFEKIWSGAPDIVCPGAGIYEPTHSNFWADNDPNSHYKVLDINLLHPIKTTRIAVRRMLRHSQPGVVVHISSIGAQYSSIVTPLYQASKAGISSFIRSMAPLDDLARVRVVGVAPGTIGTPLFFAHEKTRSFLDLDKDFLLPPEEVANGMIALCEQEETYPSGTVLEIADEGQESWRLVNCLNDPGPSGRATTVSNKNNAIEEVKEWLRKDRGVD